MDAERNREFEDYEAAIAKAAQSEDTLNVTEPNVGSALIRVTDVSKVFEAADALRGQGWEVITSSQQGDGQVQIELKLK